MMSLSRIHIYRLSGLIRTEIDSHKNIRIRTTEQAFEQAFEVSFLPATCYKSCTAPNYCSLRTPSQSTRCCTSKSSNNCFFPTPHTRGIHRIHGVIHAIPIRIQREWRID
jgi:hypothetical protein